MKTRKLTKLVAVLLTVALMVGAMVGVNASAANTADPGSATIISKNVEHGVELALCFAVEAGTVEGELYLLVWDWTFDGSEYTYDNAQQKHNTSHGTVTITNEGVSRTGEIFVANSVAAKDLDGVITVRTCIVTDTGCVYGKVLKYSVLAYTEQKLLEIVGDDTLTDEEKAIQANVCNSIIRYNAAAEAVLGKGAEPEEN